MNLASQQQKTILKVVSDVDVEVKLAKKKLTSSH
jgi:hypothetical protein